MKLKMIGLLTLLIFSFIGLANGQNNKPVKKRVHSSTALELESFHRANVYHA